MLVLTSLILLCKYSSWELQMLHNYKTAPLACHFLLLQQHLCHLAFRWWCHSTSSIVRSVRIYTKCVTLEDLSIYLIVTNLCPSNCHTIVSSWLCLWVLDNSPGCASLERWMISWSGESQARRKNMKGATFVWLQAAHSRRLSVHRPLCRSFFSTRVVD